MPIPYATRLPASRIFRALTMLLTCLLLSPGTIAIMIGDAPPKEDKDGPHRSAADQEIGNKTAIGHFGTHGMALFGGQQGLYASHLPMFHPRHDVQVVFRLHLQDATRDAELRQRLARHPQLWTLEPEKFDLQRLAPGHPQPLRQFSAKIVQGHFERDGTLQYEAQTVVVEQILLYHALAPELKQARMGQYMVIGRGKEHFVLKQIDRRPDFDWISVLHAPENTRLPAQFRIPNRQHAGKLLAPDANAWHKALQPWRGRAKIGKNLYFETGDLE